jgi:Ca2+:H+ antiporter
LLTLHARHTDIASRIYLHNPPGENNALKPVGAPSALKDEEHHLATAKPEVNVWAALLVLAVTITLMAVTAEMLVESIEHVREEGRIREEWFGLILLPLVSFAADGVVATLYFLRYSFSLFLGKPEPPAQLAKGRAIDMSIQFTLFWYVAFSFLLCRKKA